MLKKRWYRIVLFALTIVLYVAANILDYSYTVRGISAGLSPEGNPVGQDFIKIFGVKKGLQVYKFILITLLTISTVLIEIGYCQQKKLEFPTTILCWILGLGSLLTLVAVGMWIRLFLSS